MKTRIYDNILGLVLGLCVMGLFSIWQSDQIRRWERLYWDQDFEIEVHRNYGTANKQLACQLMIALDEQAKVISQLTAELTELKPSVAAATTK